MKIIFLVSNDLSNDQRVQRHSKAMQEQGYDVLLLGRLKKNTNHSITIPLPTKRFKLLFERSFLFYACLNIRFFIYLVLNRSSYDVIWVNDLDTLPSGFFAARLTRKKIVYDSHEFFTGVPELTNKPFVRSFWKGLERFFLKRITTKITVNHSIAKLYKETYNVDFEVVRNINASRLSAVAEELPTVKGFSYDDAFIIYQGQVNKDRGLEEMITAMQYIEKVKLLIVGDGDVLMNLKEQVMQLAITSKVYFTGALSPTVLQQITPLAFAGITFEKPTNLNYKYCLPNKLFDYIQAEIPIIAYPNPEVKVLVEQYEIGLFIKNHTSEEIENAVQQLMNDSNHYSMFKRNTLKAKEELTWKKEKEVLKRIIYKI